MKTLLTSEFLRGCLFAALISYAFTDLVSGAWMGIFPTFQPFQFFISIAVGSIYLILSGSVFFKPRKTSKAVFVFLTALCGIPFLAYYLRANSLQEVATGYSPQAIHIFLRSLVAYASVAFLAFAHHRFIHQTKEAEQGAAANP